MLPVSRRILEIILENQEGEEFPDKCDAVSISINSSRGKCIEALINYALRRCRLADKTKSGRAKIWHSDLKFLFEKEFSKISDSNHEFVTLFANYLPNFIYLDRDWTLEHLPLAFDKDNEKNWSLAFQGYSYVGQAHPDIYQFLKDGQHFQKGLDFQNFEILVKNKIYKLLLSHTFRGMKLLKKMDLCTT